MIEELKELLDVESEHEVVDAVKELLEVYHKMMEDEGASVITLVLDHSTGNMYPLVSNFDDRWDQLEGLLDLFKQRTIQPMKEQQMRDKIRREVEMQYSRENQSES